MQYFKTPQLTRPATTFVFLDEQADTLNDGFFVNRLEDQPSTWGNLPGSYHGGAASFAFADGHQERHRWLVPETIRPVRGARMESFPGLPGDGF